LIHGQWRTTGGDGVISASAVESDLQRMKLLMKKRGEKLVDWKKSAIEDLRNYTGRKESLDNIRERIGALKEHYASIKCSLGSDTGAVQGGGSQVEDRMLNNIVERQRLSYTYSATKRLIELTERGLAGLDDKEQKVLQRMFISPEKGAVSRLCDELGYEQAQVYRMKDQVLYSFTVREYGLPNY
jgi:DNA-directed RNA polymerase specialized sigma subunit